MSLREEFKKRYGAAPAIYRAPGRVNLIGEHTDYNDGFVMPATIGFWTQAAVAPRTDRTLRVASLNDAETIAFDLDTPPRRTGKWHDYVIGVVVALRQADVPLGGADLLVEGNVPIGAGLSSSASLEVACALALLAVSRQSITPINLARVCQTAENAFVGMRCGIMDQFASVFGKVGHALLLDCRSLEARPVPLPNDISLVICNSGVHHALAGSEYNARRADCEEGVRQLAKHLPGIAALRDVTLPQIEELAGSLPSRIARRCRHVVHENARVLEVADALQARDLQKVCALLNASHVSLRDDYEVSCRELDVLVDLAADTAGVHGARITGGGFGGCTVNLVQKDRVDAFADAVTQGYERATGRRPAIYVCEAVNGAGAAE